MAAPYPLAASGLGACDCSIAAGETVEGAGGAGGLPDETLSAGCASNKPNKRLNVICVGGLAWDPGKVGVAVSHSTIRRH